MIRIEHSKYNTVSTQNNTVSKSQLLKLRVGPKQQKKNDVNVLLSQLE